MGQKVNPIGVRVGINRLWDSIWYADKDYANNLLEDLKIRQYLKKTGGKKDAAISRITIERFPERINVNIFTARPAIIIGRKGSEIDKLRGEIQKLTDNKKVQLKIVQIKRPETDAQLIAENIAEQIKKRIPYRRAMKQAISNALRSGALGIKVVCSGRLAGAEMARQESYKEGRIPLQTLRAKVLFGFATSETTLGAVGVKVWIYKGDSMDPFKTEA
ncbi:MAG: 30S ribosomal protein S3 [Spirochaetes bacterium]|nr:30S ribosomal protein S3 [Spirochaetota bacterium]